MRSTTRRCARGLIAINLQPGDELVQGDPDQRRRRHLHGVEERDDASGSPRPTCGPMGRATAGVRGMKLKNADDAVVGCDVARDGAVMLFVSSSGHGKRTKLDAFNRQGRGGQGVRGMKITASRGAVVAAFTVTPDDEILVFSSGGNIIRMGVKEISAQGRDATGVRVARLEAGETVERRRAGAGGRDAGRRGHLRPMGSVADDHRAGRRSRTRPAPAAPIPRRPRGRRRAATAPRPSRRAARRRAGRSAPAAAVAPRRAPSAATARPSTGSTSGRC